jgi:hypothetical protein
MFEGIVGDRSGMLFAAEHGQATMFVKLQDWSVRSGGPGEWFLAPEVAPVRLEGVVTGHPRKSDGKRVVTTRIVESEGRIVTTRSGTKYRLGRIQRGYRRWLTKKGLAYNPRQPIKVKNGFR